MFFSFKYMFSTAVTSDTEFNVTPYYSFPSFLLKSQIQSDHSWLIYICFLKDFSRLYSWDRREARLSHHMQKSVCILSSHNVCVVDTQLAKQIFPLLPHLQSCMFHRPLDQVPGAHPYVPQHLRVGRRPRTSGICHRGWFSSFPRSSCMFQQNLGSSQ